MSQAAQPVTYNRRRYNIFHPVLLLFIAHTWTLGGYAGAPLAAAAPAEDIATITAGPAALAEALKRLCGDMKDFELPCALLCSCDVAAGRMETVLTPPSGLTEVAHTKCQEWVPASYHMQGHNDRRKRCSSTNKIDRFKHRPFLVISSFFY